MAEQDQEGFLVSAARKLGSAAGRAAKVAGVEGAKSEEGEGAAGEKGHPSLRAQRVQSAAAAKKSAAALSKSAFADDVRFRRIVGKPPEIWSDEDVEYVNGLLRTVQAH